MTSSGRVDLTGIRERAAEATPGTWRIGGNVITDEYDVMVVTGQRTIGRRVCRASFTAADAAFIASVSPDVVLALIEAVEAAQELHSVLLRSDFGSALDDVTDGLTASLLPFVAAAVPEGTT